MWQGGLPSGLCMRPVHAGHAGRAPLRCVALAVVRAHGWRGRAVSHTHTGCGAMWCDGSAGHVVLLLRRRSLQGQPCFASAAVATAARLPARPDASGSGSGRSVHGHDGVLLMEVRRYEGMRRGGGKRGGGGGGQRHRSIHPGLEYRAQLASAPHTDTQPGHAALNAHAYKAHTA